MGFDIYIDSGRWALERIRRYREVALEVKRALGELGVEARVYVFGSAPRGRYTAASDIDILIVAELDRETAQRVKAELYRRIDAPIELHIATPRELDWYMRFIDTYIEI